MLQEQGDHRQVGCSRGKAEGGKLHITFVSDSMLQTFLWDAARAGAACEASASLSGSPMVTSACLVLAKQAGAR